MQSLKRIGLLSIKKLSSPYKAVITQPKLLSYHRKFFFSFSKVQVESMTDFDEKNMDFIEAIGLLLSHDYRKAIKHLESLLSKSDITDNNSLRQIIMSIGAVYLSLSELSKAKEYLERFLKHEDNSIDPLEKAKYLRLLATINCELDLECNDLFGEAVGILSQLNHKVQGMEETAILFSEYGEYFFKKGYLDSALEYWKKCENIFQLNMISIDPLIESKLHARLARLYNLKGDEKKCSEHTKRSLNIIKEYDENPGLFIHNGYMSKLFFETKNYQRAQNTITDAIAQLGNKIGSNSFIMYKFRKELAEMQYKNNNKLGMISLVDIQGNLKPIREHEILGISICELLSEYYISEGRLKEGEDQLQLEIKLVMKIYGTDSPRLKRPYYDFARVIKEKNPNEAIQYLLKQLKLGEPTKDISDLDLKAKVELAELYSVVKNFNLSQANIKEVLTILDKRTSNEYLLLKRRLHYVQASNHFNQKNYQLAMVALERIKTIEEAHPDLPRSENVYHKIAIAQIKLQMVSDAMKSLESAIKAAENNEILYNNNIGAVYLDLAGLLKDQKHFEEALEFYEAAIEFFKDRDEDRELVLDIYHEAGEVCQKLKRFKEAKNYFMKAVA